MDLSRGAERFGEVPALPAYEGHLRTRNPNDERKLVVVSNRVVLPDHDHVGGLGQALKSAFNGAEGAWLGWSGHIGDSDTPSDVAVGAMHYRTVDLSQALYDRYYKQFSNEVLWPALHGRLDVMRFRTDAYAGYLEANRRFADLLPGVADRQDPVWVHDYHLIPLACMARERGFEGPFGFFLHTPVPPAQTLSSIPRHRELLRTLADYDLVGVQTHNDLVNLRDYFRREHGAHEDTDGWLRLPSGRAFRVAAFPIGIDHEAIAALADAGSERPRVSIAPRRPMSLIGVDRLDYSKGIPNRIRAFGRLLADNRSLCGEVELVQVAPPSRSDVAAYKQLAKTTGRLVERVNTRHGTDDWQPIRFVAEALPLSRLAVMYRQSRVGLVTPLRDGMNLVAKEYVAAQDPLDPGVLVLSCFAGAAYELTGALMVNPHDIEGCADAIARAIAMPRGERRERWQAMMTSLRDNDVRSWGARFVAQLRDTATTAEVETSPRGQRIEASA